MNNIDNCSICGKIFIKTVRDICTDCIKEEIKVLKEVKDFLRKNKYATFIDCVENTDVTEKQLSKLILDKRILMTNNPNMGVKCRKCENITQDPSQICIKCKEGFKEELDKFTADEKTKSQKHMRTYYTT